MENKDINEISDVKTFWNTEACGTHFIENFSNDREFYEKYSTFRYETEWHIPLLVPFQIGKDKKVLEIGCGNGADGVRWAKEGAIYTGIDLTNSAVESTQKHFDVLGLKGEFKLENAEALSFQDETFDIVYSHGVLHHSPHPLQTFSEVKRVLKPGGRAIIMLYHKNSFNYYIRILVYMRLRLLLKIISRIGRYKKDKLSLDNKNIRGIRGNEHSSVWKIHYENFLLQGWDYLKARNFVHHCTDGPECPFAFVYNKSDIRKIFKDWNHIDFKIAHFPIRKYKYAKWIPIGIENFFQGYLVGIYSYI